MSPKTGRPPSDDPRKTIVETRMSKKELEKLEHCCKAFGMTKSEVIREGIDRIYICLSENE